MKKLPGVVIGIFAVFILLVLFGNSMFFKLNTAEYGVIFRQFDANPLDKENIVGPGFTIMAPWNDLIKYDASEQKIEERMTIQDKNGLSIDMDVTIIFNPDPHKIGYLHEKFLGSYQERLVIPQLRSAVRRIGSKYTAEEIYAKKRVEVELEIKRETEQILSGNYVLTKDLLIRNIQLPDDLKKAIEFKQTKEQEALAMQFVNEKERLEAERKAIEAKGIADFNNIVNASLNKNILLQRGIEATLKLSESPNTKIVVVGSGENGLPLILSDK